MKLVEQFLNYVKLPTSHSPNGMPNESIRVLKIYITRYANYIKNESPSKHNLADFLSSLNISNNLKSTLCNRIGKFLRWENYISEDEFKSLRNIFKFIPNDWSNKSLPINQIPKILQTYNNLQKKHYTRIRDLLMIYIMATIGCRVSQVTQIVSIETTEDGFIITFPKIKYIPKTTQPTMEKKKIPLEHHWGNFYFANLYKEYISTRTNSKYFFSTRQGKKISENYLRNVFKKLSDRLSQHITPHTLRHTVGTYIANKYGILQANLLLGHSRLETTQRYIQPQYVEINVPSI